MPYEATSFWERIRLLARQPTWWVEVGIALSLTTWALIVAWDGNRLDPYAYHIMLKIASGSVWAYAALAAGLFHIVALVTNGRSVWTNGHNWRAVASFLSAWFIGTILYNFVTSKHFPPMSAFVIIPLAMDLVALVKNFRRTA